MVNNFDIIHNLIDFEKKDNLFLFVQIVQRAKDYVEKVKEGPIHTFIVRSDDELLKVIPDVIMLCEHYNARAYVSASPKSFKKVNNEMALQLAKANVEGNSVNPMKVVNSSIGRVKGEIDRWIIDVDDPSQLNDVRDWLDVWFAEHNTLCGLIIVPTVSGYHIIPDGIKFNTKEFNREFPDIMIHRNSIGTLLYAPSKTK